MCAIGSAIGPIIVMIDANRLSHSLATALKDRPHGIPVQPNRSLPLRPPPPPPARISVSKSPKCSSLTPSPTPEIRKSKDSCNKRSSVDRHFTKEGNYRIGNDLLLTNLGVMGMKFYDSQEKDDDSRKKSDQYRQSKSLDHEESDEPNSGDKRRNSFDSEIIDRHKKNNSFNSGLTSAETTPPKEKIRRGSYARKRKLSSDDNSDGYRTEKPPKVPKIAPTSKTNNRVESSGIVLPNIIRSRGTSYTPIRPKLPPGVPECPLAIPIEVAQAINQNGSTSPKNNAEVYETNAQLKPRIPKIRIIQNGRRFSQQIEDLENTLPSMPSLDLDSQSDNLKRKNREKAARQLVPNGEAKVSRVMEDLSTKTNCQTVQEDLDSIEDKIYQTCSDVLATNQAVLQVNILSYSEAGVVMTLPQIVTNGNVGGAIEATSPETMSSSIQNGEQIGQNDVLQSEDEAAELLNTSGSCQSEISGGDESMVDTTNVIRKESQVRSKVDVDKVKSRIQQKLAKLKKFYKEKRHLELKMEQTNDPSRLTRLQQRKNFNDKRIENYEKQVERNRNSVETLSRSETPPQVRIQVRQDLVDTTSAENVEPVRQSPFVPCIEDESPVANSPWVSSPLVITISDNETDSASSDEEGYVIDEGISDSVKPTMQTDPGVKVEMKHVPTNDVEHDSSLPRKDDYRADPLIPPDVKVKPDTLTRECIPFTDDLVPSVKESEMTNSNVEYMDKNSQSDNNRFPTGIEIQAIKSLPPLIRDPIINYSAKVVSPAAEPISPSREYRSKDLNSVIERFDRVQMTGVAEMKSPNAEYGAQNKLNSGPERFDGVNPKCQCIHCLQSNTSVSVQNQSQSQSSSQARSEDVNNYMRTPVILSQTVNQENLNSQPVTNYAAHPTDYRTQGNATSMFSRDNGGANINLSSPLQGHFPTPALSLPPYSQRHLTAQGHQMPGKHSPNYQPTQQWFNQHPGTKLAVPFTPDQDGATHPSILAAHLLRSQSQEPGNVSRPSNKPSLTEQFPTLSKWAAGTVREPAPRKPVNKTTSPMIKPHPVIKQNTGSDMYKMTASAVDARYPAARTASSLHWQQTRLWTEQQRPPPAYPVSRNNPPLYRPNYQQARPQNVHNTSIAIPGSQGPVYVQHITQPYRPTASLPQSNRNTEYSAAIPQKKQLPYYPTASSIQQTVPVSYQNHGQVNSGNPINSLAMMQNNYIPQAQYSSLGAIQQWMASNYSQQQYLSSQYNGCGTQAKPTDKSARYAQARQPNNNCAPVIVTHETVQRREQMAPSLQMSENGYINRVIQPNRVVQDGLNETLDLGRSNTIPQSTSRLSNMKCSLCGRSDPKFNCTECGAAFYCNRHCQAQHWRTHSLECPQKMPKLKKVL